MRDAEVVHPLYLLAATLAVPLVLSAYALARRLRRRALERYVPGYHLPLLAPSERPLRYYSRAALASFGLSLVLVALARPRWGTKLEVVSRKGVDVIVALDTSLSMLTEDVKPNRLGLAKREVTDLIDRLQGDRIGIVAFAGEAYVACPLTLDYGAAKMFLDDIGPSSVSEAGTAVGTAIRRAIQAFGRKETKHKVLLLMTDGEDQATDPLGAAKEAKEAGVVVHAIGFGTPAGAPIPLKDEGGNVGDYKKDESGKLVMSRLDEATLAEVATKTGGAYHRASGSEIELDKVVEAVGGMDRTELSQKLYAMREERFQYPLVLGLGLLLVEALLRARLRRPGAVAAPAIGLIVLCALPSPSAAAPPLTGVASEVEEGNDLYQKGKLDEALSAYTRAKAKDPASPAIPYNVANVLYRQKKYGDATAEYRRTFASASRPETGEAGREAAARSVYNAGNALFRDGKIEEALQSYADAIRRDPKDRDAKWNYELAKLKLEEQQKKKQQQQQQDKDQKEDQDQKQDKDHGKSDDQKSDEKQQQDQNEPSESEKKQDEEKKADEQKKQADEKKAKEQKAREEQEKKQAEAAKEQEGHAADAEKGEEKPVKEGELTKEQAERVLDAYLQLEREAKQQADRKRQRPRAGMARDW